VSRVAELLTIVALLAGACVIMADLGRPMAGLRNLPAYARPTSPFYGTFTLVVAGYLFSSLVFFFLTGRRDAAPLRDGGPRGLRWFYRAWASGYRGTDNERARHRRTSFWLSLTILPLLVTAHSTLGFIFGLQSGRPGWYSALQAPAFVVLAGVSGTGMVMLAAFGLRRMFGLHEHIPDTALRWLGTLLWILSLVYLYFMIVEELTASYAAPAADRHVAHEVVAGTFSPLFWVTVACLLASLLLPLLMFLRRLTSMRWLVIAAVLANVAAVLKRVLIVVPSQTHGALLPVDHGEYAPTTIEYGIIVGLFGLVAFAMLVFARVFPVVPTHVAPVPRAKETHPRGGVRQMATWATALVALALIAVGLADSFRLFSGPELDPRIPYSPVMFAGGVMLLFSSAIVYELIPDPKPVAKPMPAPADATQELRDGGA
jgi:molybdopterin-containing oxidoreductase family membrane subunit